MRRLFARTTPLGWLDAGIVLSVIVVTVWSLHPNLLFSSSLITGGDTGSHLAMPAFLRSIGDPFNLTPWYPGWFAGMPAYTYYFVLPDFFATLGSYVIGFAVAFKLATILGSVVLPITAYVMARLFRAPRPIPAALAIATLPFLFDASFTIDGGNLFSTMAGEYAFSLSLALALLSIGFFARGARTGRGYWLAAVSLSLSLAAHFLPWLFALGAIGVVVLFEVAHRRGFGDPRERGEVRGDYARPVRFAVGAGLLSLGLSAWWLLPFVTTQSLTDSLGYVNDPTSTWREVFSKLGWFNATGGAAGDRWVIVLAVVAVVVALWVRDRLGMVLATLTVLSAIAFVVDPQSAIWNERLVPFWFLSIHLVAGWLVGYVGWRWAWRSARPLRWSTYFHESTPEFVADDGYEFVHVGEREDAPAGRGIGPGAMHHLELSSPALPLWRSRRLFLATAIVGLLGLLSTVPGLITPLANDLHLATGGNQVSAWAEWNYSGYQAKSSWPEYHELMDTMGSLGARYGCGRAMWEYNSSENRFGTPEALMLLPYWTNNCIDSMEGLLMESSPTTPYHYLDQSELSVGPSDPQVGLDYEPVDVTEGVRHLQILGVKYFMAFSPAIVAEANADPSLSLVASSPNWPAPGVHWRIYLVRSSPMVESLAHLPNVVANISSQSQWLDANEKWWITKKLESVYAAETGPANWPRASAITSMNVSAPLPAVSVSHLHVGLENLSFHVSRVGVPMLVKISYYPRWHVTGATGPYRVSPNLMVVVPTSHDVSLTYGTTTANQVGKAITLVSVLAGLATLGVVVRRRKLQRR